MAAPDRAGTDGAGVDGTAAPDRAGMDSNAAADRVTGDPEAGSAPQERARQVCLRMLTMAPRTRAQLADAMRRKGVPAGAAEAVLGRLAEVGLIDDAAFARAWVESRHHARGLSSRALTAELERRGVPGADVQAAVGALDPDEEIATARRLVAKAMAGTRGKPPQARVRRLMGLLARKGYSAPLAYRVVREALEREGIEGTDAGFGPDIMDDVDDVAHATYE